jgi:hypothetical protein
VEALWLLRMARAIGTDRSAGAFGMIRL